MIVRMRTVCTVLCGATHSVIILYFFVSYCEETAFDYTAVSGQIKSRQVKSN